MSTVKMNTIKLTLGQAIVKYLTAQKVDIEGQQLPLFHGVFAIFGHGNEKPPFNNLLQHCRTTEGGAPKLDFAAHAAAMGALSEKVNNLCELESALERAKVANSAMQPSKPRKSNLIKAE